MELEKNFYGLSEGVFKACQFLGLKFPSEVPKELQSSDEHMPSDYFGNDFELTAAMRKKLCAARKWTVQKFDEQYELFAKRFAGQKPLKKTKTDLNIYFCDFVLFVNKQLGAYYGNYIDFEFYNKTFEERRTFLVYRYIRSIVTMCNEYEALFLTQDKSTTNALFAKFLHRDWINPRKCSFEDFKAFVEKHSRFFSKLLTGTGGLGAKIIQISPDQNLDDLFASLKSQNRVLEEIVTQHESLSAFCSDTVNTVRLYTLLDHHNTVNILAGIGRFGRMGNVADNFHSGGYSVIVDPQTGLITSDGINRVHERAQKHPDTGKTFKGFQYPCWEKIRATVTETAKLLPRIRYVGWDITINDKEEIVLIEANAENPGVDALQAPDSTGRKHLYQSVVEEFKQYTEEHMRILGYRENNLRDFDSAYKTPLRTGSRLKFAIDKLIPDCSSLMDVGCRNSKLVKSICSEGVKYFPVDFKAHDAEIIACDFNADFPDIKADACLCAFTAEFAERLPKFLANMCNAAQKQILMICRPVDKERDIEFRWRNPFLTDFTEEFLIKTMAKNKFRLDKRYPSGDKSVILYDFRKISK